MTTKTSFLMLGSLWLGLLSAATPAAAQAGLHWGKGPQEDQRLVIGTRFVRGGDESTSPKRLFDSHRVPLSDFNAADHCVDRGLLAMAEQYFQAFGWKFAQTGFYYPLPSEDIKRATETCSVGREETPVAISVPGTSVIAFGMFVSKDDAPALRDKIR